MATSATTGSLVSGWVDTPALTTDDWALPSPRSVVKTTSPCSLANSSAKAGRSVMVANPFRWDCAFQPRKAAFHSLLVLDADRRGIGHRLTGQDVTVGDFVVLEHIVGAHGGGAVDEL